MEETQSITVIIFAGGQELLIRLDHEISLRPGADPLTVRLDQMLNCSPDQPFIRRKERVLLIDPVYEVHPGNRILPALVAFKDSQNRCLKTI